MPDNRATGLPDDPPAEAIRQNRRMSLSLRQIEVFRAIMVTGSSSAAGRMLHVSQPAISRVLALTESRVGYPLFDRVKSRLVPTREATRLFSEVEQIYDRIESVNDLAVSLGESGFGILRLISSASFGQRMIPGALTHLYATSPRARVDFRSATFDQMVGHFLAGRANLGISLQPCDNPSLTSIEIGSVPLACIAPASHRLRELRQVRPRDISACQWIAYPPDAPLGRALKAFFGDTPQPRTTIEVHSPSTAVTLVKQGLGVAVVDLWSLSPEVLPLLTVKPVAPPVALTIWATYSNVDPLPLLGRRMLAAVRKVIDEDAIKL